MNTKFLIFLLITIAFNIPTMSQKYKYETFQNDPLNVKSYTLPNGLKILISENHETPRIQTMIAVKAGSKFDPPQTTGLAHYLEHMVFKGSPSFGTKNWEKEKDILDKISELFETHLNAKNEEEKKEIYKSIDSLSYEASKFAIPNEYDKMVTSLGASGTNAFTSNDMTVYINEIPSNALDKFFLLESERFPNLVLRIFHTELETVYEEFNRSQDNDARWSYANVVKGLFPNHPYGTQTTIGEGEHLKNPSMVNIYKYHKDYYVPNNMAIIVTGDVNPDEVVLLAEKHFGKWIKREVPIFKQPENFNLKEPVFSEYSGPQPEHIRIGFKFDKAGSYQAMMADLISQILYNGQAGLFDLNLNQKQKVLTSSSFLSELHDYSTHMLYAEPKKGQSLEELKELLLSQLEIIKKGEFTEELVSSIITNKKLLRMKDLESNERRASLLMNTFVMDLSWNDYCNELDKLSKIKKSDIVDFAKKYYTSNYSICFKKIGDPLVHKVTKPKITPIVMNKDTSSQFKLKFDEIKTPTIKPKFADFDKDISKDIIGSEIPFSYVHNTTNKLFSLSYILDMGTDHDKYLGLAVSYLPYLGTSKYSASDLKLEFYKLGLSFTVNSSKDRSYITLSGLDDNLEKGVQLFEHILQDVTANDAVYHEMLKDIEQKRINAKKNKSQILNNGLLNWAKYGPTNPFNNQLKNEELTTLNPEDLTAKIKNLNTYKHSIFYFGSRDKNQVLNILKREHKYSQKLKEYPEPSIYKEEDFSNTKIFYCSYNMKQTEIIVLSKVSKFNKTFFPYAYLYNDYFGSGLSSIVFQEIREKMALAYAASSRFIIPEYKHESHYVINYLGTQSDKLKTGLDEFNKLMEKMPKVEEQYVGVVNSLLKSFETDWYKGADVFWAADRASKRGLNYDVRKDVYENLSNIGLNKFVEFYDVNLKSNQKVYLIIGKKEEIDFNYLNSLGNVTELTTEQLFGY